MDDSAPIQTITPAGDRTRPDAGEAAVAAALPTPTQAGAAALAAPSVACSVAQALAKKATAAATLRAYKADWTHFAAWCTAHDHHPDSSPSRRRRRPSAPTSPAWPTATPLPPSAGGYRHWARCTGSTTWRGTQRTAISRARCKARCAAVPARRKRRRR